MNDDVADGLLLDLRGVSIAELLDAEENESVSLNRALKRILNNVNSDYCSFASQI